MSEETLEKLDKIISDIRHAPYWGDNMDIELLKLKEMLKAELAEAERRGEERGFEAGRQGYWVTYVNTEPDPSKPQLVRWDYATLDDWRASEEYKEGK